MSNMASFMSAFSKQILQWDLTETQVNDLQTLFKETVCGITDTVEIYTEAATDSTEHFSTEHLGSWLQDLEPSLRDHQGTTSSESSVRFSLALAQDLQALLTANCAVDAGADAAGSDRGETRACHVALTFDHGAIAAWHRACFGTTAPPLPNRPGNARLQHALAAALLNGAFMATAPDEDWAPMPPHEAVADRAAALATPDEVSLLTDLMALVHQGTELPVATQHILEAARSHFGVDRAVIYQFQVQLQSLQLWRQPDEESNPSIPLAWNDPQWQTTSDGVTYEARATTAVPSILYQGDLPCFGTPLASGPDAPHTQPWCGDRETPAAAPPSLLSIPIDVHSRQPTTLWGLLVLHPLDQPRPWSDRDIAFATALARLLAIAISLAQVEAQLQQQKHALEHTLGERNRQLKEALAGANAANRAKNAFLATVSHELRTPLTCVIGLSATLMRWSIGQLNQQQHSYLQTIHDSGEHLLGLIEAILDFSQVEGGRSATAMVEFSITQVVYQVLQSMRDSAQGAGIAMAVDLPLSQEDDRFVADPHRVRQILMSLMSNAVKFTPAGGRVVVRAWREGGGMVLQVEDTGIGISDEGTRELFTDFEQLDASYHRTHGGLGLGLALVKKLVDLHQGWIEVDSVPDNGSTFTVWLPQYVPQKLPHPVLPEPMAPPPGQARGQVVLIDAQEERAMVICDLLTAADYQVVWDMNGFSSITQTAILKPQVAIIDMAPEADGWGAIAALRYGEQCTDCRVLAMGGDGLPPPPAFDRDLMADDTLNLPIEPDILLRKVDGLMADRRTGHNRRSTDRPPSRSNVRSPVQRSAPEGPDWSSSS